MAAPTLSDVAAILAKKFDHGSLSQINREAKFFQWLPKKPSPSKAADWRVAGSGATVSKFASGGAIATATFDERVAATLAWGRYGQRISIADDAYTIALGQGMEAVIDLFEEEVMLASRAIAKSLEGDLFAGDGTSNAIVGVATGIKDADTYAGIDPSSKTWWKSAAYGTAGSELAMTLADFGQFEKAIFDQYGAPLDGSNGDAYFTTSANYDKYVALLGANPQQIVNEGGVDLAGGARSLSYGGVPVLRSGSCTTDRVYGVRKDEVELLYVPMRAPNGAVLMNDRPAPAGETGMETGQPVMLNIKPLGASGAAQDYLIYIQVALKVRSRFAHGVWRVDTDGTA